MNNQNPKIEESYDQFPYPSYAYTLSHPAKIAVIGKLLGLETPDVNNCRVLELGCAAGGNLIPMGYGLPRSTFVGVDLSETQINEGRALIEKLSIKNVSLLKMDLLNLGELLDPGVGFDYIIAHGVYSWVPKNVKISILNLCGKYLTKRGLAYISFNTYPGWHQIEVVREMMLFHSRNCVDPEEKARTAREKLAFMAEAMGERADSYALFVKKYADMLQDPRKSPKAKQDAFILHDELSLVNDPDYFYQFVEKTEKSGLQYLGDADFPTMMAYKIPKGTVEGFKQISSDLVAYEQNKDFYSNRSFRRALLCQKDIELSRSINPSDLKSFYMSSHVKIKGEKGITLQNGIQTFEDDTGVIFSTDHQMTKAALMVLNLVWPQFLSFDQLILEIKKILQQTGCHPDDNEGEKLIETLCANLLHAYSRSTKIVDLRLDNPSIEVILQEKPLASPIARHQAKQQEMITNLRHERIKLNPMDRNLLIRLDGQNNIDDIVLWFIDNFVKTGELNLKRGDQVIEDQNEIKRIIKKMIIKDLYKLSRLGLLER
ncbi:MAG: methyltransferase regulatory domain-containing protein [Anaerolineaceae bacterium]|nr:methyltransferase regulatory domain-containing protein [Anaerolineaceae bacterium]